MAGILESITMCLRIPMKKKEYALPRRKSTFRASAKRPVQAIQRMLDMSAMIVPTRNGVLLGDGIDGTTDGAADGASSRPRLLLSQTIRMQLERIYHLACGKDRELSREKFLAFLQHVQGEVNIVPIERESYSFQQFLFLWYMNYGLDAIRTLGPPEEEDLSFPISNYFISSSHNTYLDGDQFFSRSHPDMYKFVLKNNCRCIEIDVWNGETSGTRTPRGRSKSPNSKAGEHHRHRSQASMITASTAADAIESVKSILHKHSKTQIKRQNPSQPKLEERADSRSSPGPNHSHEGRGRPRRPSKASEYSQAKGEPRVLHGWTGTKPTGFREVCKAIKETAFVKNPLPIIVSLEVHADEEQQEVMVDIMKEEWQGILLEAPHDSCDPISRQPRLEELLNKILIKVKRPPQRAIVPVKESSSLLLAPSSTMGTEDDNASGSEDERVLRNKRTARVPITGVLSALAIYTHSEHFEAFEAAPAKTPSHIFSISEGRILELHSAKRRELFHHNRHYFMRAFPGGIRFDSSNMEPSLYWRKGVQMVALNWQTVDDGMMINSAMFHQTRGWVLKPPGYRGINADGSLAATPEDADPPQYRTVRLRVTVLAGQHIPLPEAHKENGVGVAGAGADRSFRPSVSVKLYVERQEDELHQQSWNGNGHPKSRDAASKSKEAVHNDDFYKRKTKPAETVHPDFGKDGFTMEFPEIQNVVEELGFVRFKVEDNSSYFGLTLAAWACVRMDRLQQGYRLVDLLDAKGKPTEGKLFIRVDKVVK